MKAIKIKERLADLFEEHSEKMHLAQIDLAKGLFIGIEDPETHEIIRVYKRMPSSEAYKNLLEHVVGRPNQPVEHSGEIILPQPILDVNSDILSQQITGPKIEIIEKTGNALPTDNLNPQNLEAQKTD